MRKRLSILALTMAVVLGLAGAAPAAGLVELFDTASYSSTTNSTSADVNPNAKFTGIKCFLDVTDATSPAGNQVMGVTFQELDPLSGTWATMPLATFANVTGSTADTMIIAPGVTASANRKVDDVIVNDYRARAVLTGTSPTFTFTLACVPLPPIQSF